MTHVPSVPTSAQNYKDIVPLQVQRSTMWLLELFVIGIAHIICTFSRPPAKHHSASNAMVVSVIYNPVNVSYLNSFPHKVKQFHHWPTSPDALFESLNRELLFSHETTSVGYKTITGYTETQSNSIHLSRYTRKNAPAV